MGVHDPMQVRMVDRVVLDEAALLEAISDDAVELITLARESEYVFSRGVMSPWGLTALLIDRTLTIRAAPGRSAVIRANASASVPMRVCTLVEGTLNVIGVSFTGGYSTNGGGGIDIFPGCTLSLEECHVFDNMVEITGRGTAVGGGINNLGTLTAVRSTISSNSLHSWHSQGGGLMNNDAASIATLIDVQVTGNSASSTRGAAGGGGIFNLGTLTAVRSIISSNTLISETGQCTGGGLNNALAASTVTLTNVTVTGNRASSRGVSVDGGGITNLGILVADRCTLSSNTLTLLSDFGLATGAGLMNHDAASTATLTDVQVIGNRITSTRGIVNGGGIFNQGALTAERCNISSNAILSETGSASGGGLAITSAASIATLTNVHVTGNSASSTGGWVAGGGINNLGTLMAEQCTIASNTLLSESQLASGGGLNSNTAASTATLTDVQVKGNSVSSTGDIVGGGGISNGGTLIVERCTLSTNTLTGQSGLITGGGLYNNGVASTATLTDVQVTGNRASASSTGDVGGGGIFNRGTVTAERCTFSSNTVISESGQAGGGGLHSHAATSTAILTNVNVTGNSVTSNRSGAVGGGILNQGAVVAVQCTLSSNTVIRTAIEGVVHRTSAGGDGLMNNFGASINTSHAGGGGLMNVGGASIATLTDVQVTGNRAASRGVSAAIGGGITNQGTLTAERCTLSSNTLLSESGQASGGGFNNNGAPSIATLTNTEVDHNTVTSSNAFSTGGGVTNIEGTLHANRCSFSSNRVASKFIQARGGGISNQQGIATLVATFIFHNVATHQGGGLHNSDGSVLLTNGTHLRNNTAGTGATFFGHAGETTYWLPGPGATWIAGRQCRVQRTPCDRDAFSNQCLDQPCCDTEEACSLRPLENVTVDGVQCKAPLFIQSCNWKLIPELIDSTVDTLPLGALDEDFPFDCAVGLQGSTEATYQAGPQCGGPCPAGVRSQPTASGCVCQKGLLTSPLEPTLTCDECPLHLQCEYANTQLHDAIVDANFWRIGYESIDVRPCPYRQTCKGGLMPHARYDRYSDATCTPGRGLAGPYCLLCLEPSTHYFDAAALECRSCSETTGGAIAVLVVIVGFVAAGAFIAWRWPPRPFKLATRRLKAYAMRISFRAKLRISISFLQIVTQMGRVYAMRFPDSFEALLDALSIINLDLHEWLPRLNLRCIGLQSLSSQLLFSSFVPLGIAVTPFLVAALCRQPLATALPFLLGWTFLLYPSISSFGFRALAPCDCFTFLVGGDEVCFLREDYEVVCVEGTLMRWDGSARAAAPPANVLTGAWMAVGIWAIGVPLLYAGLLHAVWRKDLRGRPSFLQLRASLGMLVGDYRDGASFWEVVCVGEKLAMTGFLALIEPGSWTQAFLGTMTALFAFVLQAHVRPYRTPSDNLFAFMTSLALIAVFLGALGLQAEPALAAYGMSINMGLEFVLLFASTLSVLLTAAAFFMIEIGTARSRVLHLVETRQPLRLPDLEGLEYHLFLSHAWVTGQDVMRVVKQRLQELLPGVRVFLDVDDLQRRKGKGAEVLPKCAKLLLFASDGVFGGSNPPSRPCMVEVLKALELNLEVITMLEVEDKHLPLSCTQLHEQLCLLDAPPDVFDTNGEPLFHSTYHRWRLVDEAGRVVTEDGGDPGLGVLPVGKQLHGRVFGQGPMIEWSRIGNLQNVSMRMIAERLLPPLPHEIDPLPGQLTYPRTYLPGEMTTSRPKLPPPSRGKRFHLCCSEHNPQALQFVHELNQELEVPLEAAETVRYVDECDRFLLHLDASTWTDAALAADVERALDAGAPLLLVHEAPGDDVERNAVPFQVIVELTPPQLLDRNIYHMIAISLKARETEWRKVGHLMVVQELAAGVKGVWLRSTCNQVQEAWTRLRLRLCCSHRDEALVSNKIRKGSEGTQMNESLPLSVRTEA